MTHDEYALNKRTNERIEYLDILRVIASLAVIILHTSAQNWENANVNSFEWGVFLVYNCAVRWATAVFVMISGALFLSKDLSLKKIYTKNIFHILTAFFAWSIAYELGSIFRHGEIKSIVTNIFLGHYHMWFLYMIIGLYMIVPFLRKIVESDYLTKYFLILSLVFAVIIPLSIRILPLILPQYGVISNGLVSHLNMYFPMGYTGYFVLGYFLNKIQIGKNTEKLIYLFGIVGLAYTIGVSYAVAIKIQQPFSLSDNLSLNILVESVAIFVWAKQRRSMNNVRLKVFIQKASKYSLGIYLLHAKVLELLAHRLNITTLSFNPLFSVPLIGLSVFAVSFVVTAVLKRIPIVKKYFV